MTRTSIEWCTDSSGRQLGALKTAARRTGVPLDAYLSLRAEGKKFCWRCRTWHPLDEFQRDSTRSDGRDSRCRKARANEFAVRPKAPHAKREQRFMVPTRDGDRRQARRRINYLVERGLLPHPNTLLCVDCGHEYDGKRRHEYDHAKGYVGENQLYVEAVCAPCHHRREGAREE